MIDNQRYEAALKAIRRLIVQAKSDAYDAGADTVAELLNDMELLPEFLSVDEDRTTDLVDALEGIATVHPRCRYIVEEFAETRARAT